MKVLASVLSTLFALIFCGLYGYIVWRDYGLWVIAVVVAMILSLPVASFLHELGHIIFGAVCKIKAVPKFRLFGSSFCRLIPKTDEKLKARLMVTSLGGIFINILVYAVVHCLVLYSIAPAWLAFIIPANIYIAILNIIPAEFASGKTDGAVCRELINDTDTSKVMLAVLTVQAQVLNGKPIEEVDENLLFGVPQICEDDQSFIALTELRYEYFKAKGDEANAEKYRQRFKDLEEYM